MDNFSLRSSQEESYVKALEVDILFDQNPIFNLQVTAISPPSSFFHLQPSTLPIFRCLSFSLHLMRFIYFPYFSFAYPPFQLHFCLPLYSLPPFSCTSSISSCFYFLLFVLSPFISISLVSYFFLRFIVLLFSLPYPLLFYWRLLLFLQHSAITYLIILVSFPFYVHFVFLFFITSSLYISSLLLPHHIAFIYYKCI